MNTTTIKPAIVIGAHTMGLGVIRALGSKGVPVVAVYYDQTRDMGYVSRYVKESIYAPHPEKNKNEFIDLLVTCSRRFGGSLLIPVSDESLVAVSQHKPLLEQHFTVACTEWEITKKFIDKKYTYALADSLGIPAPKTIMPQSEPDVEKYAQEIEYPCLIKPCQSHRYFEVFNRKMIKAYSFDQMIAAYRQANQAGLEVMFQEFIPGSDSTVVNYNSYFWGSQPLVEFTAQQVRKAPPELGSPRVVLSKDIPEVLEPGRKILGALGFYGYACTEFKKDERTGIYKLMEVNGRHNLSTLLAVRCGINFPWLHYQHLMEGKLPAAHEYEKGIYWIDIPREVLFGARYVASERYSPVQYLRPYLNRHVFAIFDRHDPKPFIKRWTDLIKKAVRDILAILKSPLKHTAKPGGKHHERRRYSH